MGKLLLGTSGYSYKDWVGTVYPAGTAQKDYLKRYAEMFSFTELNFSYYRQPDPRTLERMLYLTGPEFMFSIKGHKTLTHERGGDLRKEAQVFREGIWPLAEAGRLAAVVMQFPHSFHYTPASRKHLDMLCREFDGFPLAVEFRGSEWQRDSVYEGLRKREVGVVNVDEPALPGLLRPTAIVTAPHAYVRFHGRNAKNWWGGDNVSRYDYSYNEEELMEWLPRIQAMNKESDVLMVLFNNHFRGQAVEDAKRLMGVLKN